MSLCIPLENRCYKKFHVNMNAYSGLLTCPSDLHSYIDFLNVRSTVQITWKLNKNTGFFLGHTVLSFVEILALFSLWYPYQNYMGQVKKGLLIYSEMWQAWTWVRSKLPSLGPQESSYCLLDCGFQSGCISDASWSAKFINQFLRMYRNITTLQTIQRTNTERSRVCLMQSMHGGYIHVHFLSSRV